MCKSLISYVLIASTYLYIYMYILQLSWSLLKQSKAKVRARGAYIGLGSGLGLELGLGVPRARVRAGVKARARARALDGGSMWHIYIYNISPMHLWLPSSPVYTTPLIWIRIHLAGSGSGNWQV